MNFLRPHQSVRSVLAEPTPPHYHTTYGINANDGSVSTEGTGGSLQELPGVPPTTSTADAPKYGVGRVSAAASGVTSGGATVVDWK